jgi:hypothetical protein
MENLDCEAMRALSSVITINRDVFSRWAVKPRQDLSLNRTNTSFNLFPDGVCVRPLVLPVFIPSKVFPSLDTRIALHGRCCAHGNLLSLVLHLHFALILRPRDCTWKVLQTLSRLRLFPSPSLSHGMLPPLILTLKRHFHPSLLRPSRSTSPSPRLGVPPWVLVSQRTPLK